MKGVSEKKSRVLKSVVYWAGLTFHDVTKETGIQYRTIRRKMNGEAGWKLSECIAIKEYLNVDMPIEQLFDIDGEITHHELLRLKEIH